MRTAAVALASLLLAACTGGEARQAQEYAPDLPASWADAVTHPFLPLVPGARWRYQTPNGPATILVEVLADTRTVHGVAATVVRDRELEDGELVEETFDWFAQDEAGNVWYLGEDSREIEDGRVVGTAGSWEWGVDGALPGIIMWADPGAHVGEDYRQEFRAGIAEDWGRLVGLDERVSVPAGDFESCLHTEDWSALESGPRENKYYCDGVGPALEIDPGGTRVELVEVEGGE